MLYLSVSTQKCIHMFKARTELEGEFKPNSTDEYIHCGQRGMKLSVVLMLLELTVLLTQLMAPCEAFKVAAFNIQQLGKKKIQNRVFATALANVHISACACVHKILVLGTS